MKPWITAMLLLVLAPATGVSGQDAELKVDDAWVAEGPPTARTLAGYMVMENAMDRAAVIVGATSPQFERVEIHEAVLDEHRGMARMERVRRLEIGAGERFELAPGGYHLMLIAPRRELRAGSRVDILLELADGGRIEVQAPVRPRSGARHRHEHEDHDDGAHEHRRGH